MLSFSSLIFFAGIFLVLSVNPLHSIICLMSIFLNVAILLLAYSVEFLALIFIIVYVGAICVLFLFVIMLLNIRVMEISSFSQTFISFVGASFLTLVCAFFQNNSIRHPLIYEDVLKLVVAEENIILFSNLYLRHAMYLLMAAFILLLTLLSVIFIMMDRKENIVCENKFYF